METTAVIDIPIVPPFGAHTQPSLEHIEAARMRLMRGARRIDAPSIMPGNERDVAARTAADAARMLGQAIDSMPEDAVREIYQAREELQRLAKSLADDEKPGIVPGPVTGAIFDNAIEQLAAIEEEL